MRRAYQVQVREISFSPSILLKFPSYTFDVMRQVVRALSVSMKVSIRIDGDGVMSLQFLMPTGPSGERTNWMEYRVTLVQGQFMGIH
jgi:hypothetical protein